MSPSYDSEDAAGTQHIPLPVELESPVQFPPGPYLPEPLVLTPQIVVTPEYSALDEGVATLWAAVQLSAQVCRVNGPDQKDHDTAYGQTTGHRQVFQYGCLYDVSVEILPTAKTAIVEVLDGKACTKYVSLAHVHVPIPNLETTAKKHIISGVSASSACSGPLPARRPY
ncbi:hypothetical protein BT67DRAFT_380390 [Trichocladium antarcticum]|uniref:Uncharacterized protein n=1 Tax=Trichocladium antarcticum TaxID=1450529 RepID=A0AAN6UM68_9PEZI|nr:hypothetical protein BT67DRAFT_380390 [Trichocladium antarcticum]